MTKQGKFHSLQVKFIIVLLLALTLGLGVGTVVQLIGDFCIDNIYLSESVASQRSRQWMESFSDFVEEHQLSMHKDALEIIRWAKNQNYIYLIVEEEGSIVIESGWWDDSSYYSAFPEKGEVDADRETSRTTEEGTSESDGSDESTESVPAIPIVPYGSASDFSEADADTSDAGTERTEEQETAGDSFVFRIGSAPVQFSDGTYQVYIYDFSEQPLYELVTVASYAVALAIFIFAMIFYHQATIQQIIKLSREVENIASGNLDGPITVRSRNEIGVLAQHVDSMRASIMHEMRAEQEAWNANSDLITRMSHDIRTPLTVLLGFLELLDEGKFSQEATYSSYLGICKKNAYQLKELADKLFQYFLVFGHRDCDLNLEVTDAKVLLEQLIGEHQVLLQEQGWKIQIRRLECHHLIEVDPLYLKRLFDNLFSNIEKYADPSRCVSISQSLTLDCLHVSVHNYILPNPNPVESTNIGLKTCERIVQQLGGEFQYQKTEGEFLVQFSIPLYQESEQFSPTAPATL